MGRSPSRAGAWRPRRRTARAVRRMPIAPAFFAARVFVTAFFLSAELPKNRRSAHSVIGAAT